MSIHSQIMERIFRALDDPEEKHMLGENTDNWAADTQEVLAALDALADEQQPAVTYTRAVLVTGHDYRGNEFSYWQIYNEWFEGYEEGFVTADFIATNVYPNITCVRFGNLKLKRDEWLALGSPLELSSDQMNDLAEINSAAQRIKKVFNL